MKHLRGFDFMCKHLHCGVLVLTNAYISVTKVDKNTPLLKGCIVSLVVIYDISGHNFLFVQN